ncbi:hypothetical protein MIND_00326400 [Mycena indigotica]|uniref:Yeast cell wall synthesis Kre9/Knh1-like N-terminal domain-containing protein n=1 Tax=Mycena indigotica TaxID=2126181 RepID=A0A8H6T2A6_9AGAR|nr:uncharacterized protein MIND_00326400 [Mycena indigotica]KAF7309555.1 hypothetical protein MIND_00326400 [Mycena indigotica]
MSSIFNDVTDPCSCPSLSVARFNTINTALIIPTSPPKNMFSSVLLTAIFASRALAIVTPNAPGPGDKFAQGSTCHISWAGDSDSGSSTAWSNMAIELMTGSNEAMIHITTVATGQDGTKTGVFDYTCPEVTPNAAIYFYQFTAPGTSNFTWTTRFTITGADGSTVEATETEKGADGQPVLWGKGALVDPSKAVAAPTFNTTNTGNSNPPSGLPSSVAPAPSSIVPGGSSGTSKPASLSSPTRSVASSAPSTSGSSAAVALGPSSSYTRVWPIVASLFASVMASTLFL